MSQGQRCWQTATNAGHGLQEQALWQHEYGERLGGGADEEGVRPGGSSPLRPIHLET